jgi:hypothetical protein
MRCVAAKSRDCAASAWPQRHRDTPVSRHQRLFIDQESKMRTSYKFIILAALAALAQTPAQAQVVNTVPGQVYVSVVGDPGSVGGTCNLVGVCINPNRGLPFDYFAKSSDVVGIQASVNSFANQVNSITNGLNALGTQFAAYSQQTNSILSRLQDDESRNANGVAMAFAMAGVADLGPDEHVAFTGNWGTFEGRNGLAAGVAIRASENISFNGGIATGLNGGGLGGRAGFRIAW